MTTPSQAEIPTSCIANIGPRERRKRMTFGLVLLLGSVLVGAALIHAGVSRPWRVLLFLPLAAGATGIFQARDRT